MVFVVGSDLFVDCLFVETDLGDNEDEVPDEEYLCKDCYVFMHHYIYYRGRIHRSFIPGKNTSISNLNK